MVLVLPRIHMDIVHAGWQAGGEPVAIPVLKPAHACTPPLACEPRMLFAAAQVATLPGLSRCIAQRRERSFQRTSRVTEPTMPAPPSGAAREPPVTRRCVHLVAMPRHVRETLVSGEVEREVARQGAVLVAQQASRLRHRRAI